MNVTIKTRHGSITLNGEPAALNLITCWLYSASHVAHDYEACKCVVAEQADAEIKDVANTLFDAIYDSGYFAERLSGKEQE